MIVYGIKPSEWIPTAYIIDEWVLLAKSMLTLSFTAFSQGFITIWNSKAGKMWKANDL